MCNPWDSCHWENGEFSGQRNRQDSCNTVARSAFCKVLHSSCLNYHQWFDPVQILAIYHLAISVSLDCLHFTQSGGYICAFLLLSVLCYPSGVSGHPYCSTLGDRNNCGVIFELSADSNVTNNTAKFSPGLSWNWQWQLISLYNHRICYIIQIVCTLIIHYYGTSANVQVLAEMCCF